MTSYQVRIGKTEVPTPNVNGYITKMDARIVDANGKPLPVQRMMLHHVVFLNLGRKPGERRDGVCGRDGERFYGNGEEQQKLRLPEGYGYRIRAGDRWKIGWMLMNHQAKPDRAYIEYRVAVDDFPGTVPVTPYWVGVVGCQFSRDPIYNIRGGGAPGSTHSRSAGWTVPRDGRIVAGGAHIHGGAKELAIHQPRCGGRRLFGSRPRYGLGTHPYYNVLPVLHEPGPIEATWLLSSHGIPVSKGDRLRATARYDNELPHTRVMGFMRLYLAPPAPDRELGPCPRLPTERGFLRGSEPARETAPKVRTPLTGLDKNRVARTIDAPPGATVRAERDVYVNVRRFAFSKRNVSIPVGATIRYRFLDAADHNVTLANGPEGFGSRYLGKGRVFRKRFTKPGTYRNYCSLHPIAMTQRVVVRRR